MENPQKREYTTISLPNELVEKIKKRYGPFLNLSAFVKFCVEQKLESEGKEKEGTN